MESVQAMEIEAEALTAESISTSMNPTQSEVDVVSTLNDDQIDSLDYLKERSAIIGGEIDSQ